MPRSTAHGKDLVCRVPRSRAHSKPSLCRVSRPGTRQTSLILKHQSIQIQNLFFKFLSHQHWKYIVRDPKQFMFHDSMQKNSIISCVSKLYHMILFNWKKIINYKTKLKNYQILESKNLSWVLHIQKVRSQNTIQQ